MVLIAIPVVCSWSVVDRGRLMWRAENCPEDSSAADSAVVVELDDMMLWPACRKCGPVDHEMEDRKM